MKTKSAAYLKADLYRDQMNDGRQKIEAPDFSCVVYYHTNLKGQPCAIAYKGRAKKSTFHYRYSSEDKRSQCVLEWMESMTTNKRTYSRQPRTLEVGDVLRSSWGYDQTNIDYYLVTALKGKCQVIIVEIGQIIEQRENMCGECIPDVNSIKGEPMTKTADGDRVKIYDFASAHKITPQVVAGTKLFETSSYSSYH